VIICSKCGKENQDRYKFCLGCGTQLTPPAAPAVEASQPSAPNVPSPVRSRPSPTPPAGMPKVRTSSVPDDLPITEPEPLPEMPPADDLPRPPTAGPGMAPCSKCGTPNPVEFVFCGNCGNRLKEVGGRTSGLRSAKPEPAPRAAAAAAGKLALIRPDGSEGGSHPLHSPETTIGRGIGPLFDNDSYLSPDHAKFVFYDNQLLLEDAGSLNGVFVRITQEEMLEDGDIFRIGQELLRFDVIGEPQNLDDGTEIMGSPNPGYWGRLSIVVGPGVDGSAFPLMGEEVVLGRERGDILFSDDGYVSGTHAKISIREDGYFLTDLGSSNGTFIRIAAPRTLPSGTFVLMGQQLFRVDHRYR
jgi:pSer/pThr/pTyr-binding forkhead associated (FHA) protein